MKDRKSNNVIDVKAICQQLKLGNDQAFKKFVSENIHTYDLAYFVRVRQSVQLVIQDYQRDPTCYEQYHYFSLYKLALTADIQTIIKQAGRHSKLKMVFVTRGIIDGSRFDLLNELTEKVVPCQVPEIAEAMVYDCIENPAKAFEWLRKLTNDSLKRSFIKIAKLAMPDIADQLDVVYAETELLPEHFNIDDMYNEMLQGEFSSFIKLKKVMLDYSNRNIWKFRRITNQLLYKHHVNNNADVLGKCYENDRNILLHFSLYLAGRAGDYAAARKITDLHYITLVMYEVRGYIDAGRFDLINKIVHMIGGSDCSMIVSEILNYGDYQQEHIIGMIPKLTETILRLAFINHAIRKFPLLEGELTNILNNDREIQAYLQHGRRLTLEFVSHEHNRLGLMHAFNDEINQKNAQSKKSIDHLVNASTFKEKLSLINAAKVWDKTLSKKIQGSDFYHSSKRDINNLLTDFDSVTKHDDFNQNFDDLHSNTALNRNDPTFVIIRDLYNRQVFYKSFTDKLAVVLESIKNEISQTTWQVAGLFSGWKDGVPDTIYKIKRILTAKNSNPDVMMAEVARLLTKASANAKANRHPDVAAAYHRWLEKINHIAIVEPICTSDWLKSLVEAPVVNTVNATLKQAEWESMVDAVVPTLHVTIESLRVDPASSFEMAAARHMFDDVSNMAKDLDNVSLEKSDQCIEYPSHAAHKRALQQYCERANSVASVPTAADYVADINAYLASKASAVQEKQEGSMQVMREPLVGLVHGVAKDILEQAEANSVSAALPAVPYHTLPLLFNTHVKNVGASNANESDHVDAKQNVCKGMLFGV